MPKKRGLGAKIIDWMSHDLKQAFPEMQGCFAPQPEMQRTFAEAYPDAGFVQHTVAQILWRSNIALLGKLTAEGPVFDGAISGISGDQPQFSARIFRAFAAEKRDGFVGDYFRDLRWPATISRPALSEHWRQKSEAGFAGRFFRDLRWKAAISQPAFS